MLQEMFEESFMCRAFAIAMLLGPFCAMLGVFVTARKLSFFSDTLSHSSLTGVALGFWWGVADPTIVQILFSVLVAVGVIWLKEHTKLLTDTIMALLLSGSVALGVVILSMLKGYRGELHSYLFGDILATGSLQVVVGAVVSIIGVSFILMKMRSLTLLTLSEELAQVSGVKVKSLNYIFLLLLTLAVAFSVRLLGIILVTSLLVIPAAAARNVTSCLKAHLLLSLFLGVCCGILGTFASYSFDLPCGPSIVLTAILFFILSLLLAQIKKRIRKNRIGKNCL